MKFRNRYSTLRYLLPLILSTIFGLATTSNITTSVSKKSNLRLENPSTVIVDVGRKNLSKSTPRSHSVEVPILPRRTERINNARSNMTRQNDHFEASVMPRIPQVTAVARSKTGEPIAPRMASMGNKSSSSKKSRVSKIKRVFSSFTDTLALQYHLNFTFFDGMSMSNIDYESYRTIMKVSLGISKKDTLMRYPVPIYKFSDNVKLVAELNLIDLLRQALIQRNSSIMIPSRQFYKSDDFSINLTDNSQMDHSLISVLATRTPLANSTDALLRANTDDTYDADTRVQEIPASNQRTVQFPIPDNTREDSVAANTRSNRRNIRRSGVEVINPNSANENMGTHTSPDSNYISNTLQAEIPSNTALDNTSSGYRIITKYARSIKNWNKNRSILYKWKLPYIKNTHLVSTTNTLNLSTTDQADTEQENTSSLVSSFITDMAYFLLKLNVSIAIKDKYFITFRI